MKVSVEKNQFSYCPCLQVFVEGDALVTVIKDISMRTMTWREPRINWSAIGGVSVDKAAAFQQAMQVAIEEARKLDAAYPAGSDATGYRKEKDAEVV